MKNIIIICAFLIFIVSCDENQEQIVDVVSEKDLDSIRCVIQIANYSNAELLFINNSFENVYDICSITNSNVEAIIIDFANKYYGGHSRVGIANALDDIIEAVVAIGDNAGNKDGIFSAEERAKMSKIVNNNNGLFLLFCLYYAYQDTPRK